MLLPGARRRRRRVAVRRRRQQRPAADAAARSASRSPPPKRPVAIPPDCRRAPDRVGVGVGLRLVVPHHRAGKHPADDSDGGQVGRLVERDALRGKLGGGEGRGWVGGWRARGGPRPAAPDWVRGAARGQAGRAGAGAGAAAAAGPGRTSVASTITASPRMSVPSTRRLRPGVSRMSSSSGVMPAARCASRRRSRHQPGPTSSAFCCCCCSTPCCCCCCGCRASSPAGEWGRAAWWDASADGRCCAGGERALSASLTVERGERPARATAPPAPPRRGMRSGASGGGAAAAAGAAGAAGARGATLAPAAPAPPRRASCALAMPVLLCARSRAPGARAAALRRADGRSRGGAAAAPSPAAP
jgi:hypothetical protein